jgi:nicotinamide-nucleotide amidase
MSGLRAAVVATGDELVTGSAVDTNSAAIAARLLELGFRTERFVVLGDDEEALSSTLQDLGVRCSAIVVTGGLGPTLDDVTRSAAARAMGVDLVLSSSSLDAIRSWFTRHGRPFAASNERQAWFPRGAEILENPRGTAPGFAGRVGSARVFALPGPPSEMIPMLEAEVVPRLRREFPGAGGLAIGRFHLFGLSEGVFADLSGAWMDRASDPVLGVTAKLGVLSATLVATGTDDAEAGRRLAARAREFRERFAEWIFDEQDSDLAFVVGRTAIDRGLRIATAESCTGGLLAARLTRVPGISAVFDRGFVTYSNAAKIELLGVDPALVAEHGAVSAEVAGAMARGAGERAGARFAASVTGVAGPDGGTTEKPVGLVWFGVFADGSVRCEERRFAIRGRDAIREFAANTALDLLRRALPRD